MKINFLCSVSKSAIFSHILWLFLSWVAGLHAQDKGSFFQKIKEMKIASKEAFYDGKELRLEGDVSLENPLGKISAGKLRLAPIDLKEKEKPLPVMKLSQEVHVALCSGGDLFCVAAEIDFLARRALFFSDDNHSDVLYIREAEAAGNKKKIEMRSRQMRLDLHASGESKKEASKLELKAIEAVDQVRLSYADDYMLSGDFARYEVIKEASSPFKGVVVVDAQKEKGECVIESRRGDTLRSKKIVLNLWEETIELLEPHGNFSFKKEGPELQEGRFSAETLQIQEPSRQLILRGSVVLNTLFGTLSADEARLFYAQKEKERELKKIILAGNVQLQQLLPALSEGQEGGKREAVADFLECLVPEKEMWLTAQEPHRVLLFDGVSQMEMSAPSLKINWGASVDDFAVQGSGDVRFLFLSQEAKKLQGLFPTDQSSHLPK